MSDTEPMSDGAGDELVGRVLAGRYRVERLIGAGGMGSVYRAEHVHMRKAVALKILHREMTLQPEVVARFEREAVAAARIEHPHVAVATDFGRLEDGSFYLVLEYVEGKSLNRLIKEQRPLAPERALRIARQIAEALRAAHIAGIVHRDLKPDNVMLVEREGDVDYVKVLDFGIAKLSVEDSNEQLTKMGTVFGTPEYMAPEQAQGASVDARADLYTLGILLYEMLAGVTPFKDEDLIVVLTRQLTMDPPPLPASIDPAVQSLVMTLLAKLPGDRIQTAEALIQHIDGLIGVSMLPSPGSVGTRRSSAALDATLGGPSASLARPELPPSSARLSVAAMSERASNFVSTTRDAIERAMPEPVRTSLAGRRVLIAGRRIPVWAVVAGATVVLFAGSILVARLGDEVSAEQSSVAMPVVEPQRDLDAELKVTIEKARAGDRAAVAELQQRAPAERGALEWQALAEGLIRMRQLRAAVDAYGGAVAKDPGLSSDKTLLGNIRRAAEQTESSDAALRLAAASLGAAGADLLYDVWMTFRRSKDRQELAERARALLDSEAARKNATPALRIALELHAAKGCVAYSELMPRAVEHADERSVSLLKPLGHARGCGFLGLGDCYSCLRRTNDLAEALRNAQSRPAPTFLAAVNAPSSVGR